MQAAWETFDHTADMGVRVRAATLPELLRPATDGLYATIGELTPGAERAPHRFELSGPDAPTLLRDYLAEVLYLFECRARLVASLDAVRFDAHHLTADAALAPLDETRSTLLREVKAVTYHALDIIAVPGGLEATFIVDI